MQYKALVGLSIRQGDTDNFADVEAGAITDWIPEVSVGWLLEQGYIEPVTEANGGQENR